MKSFPLLALLERGRISIVHGTGHHVGYIQKQLLQLKEVHWDLNLSSKGRSRRPVVRISDRSNDRKPMVLDPGKNPTRGVGKFEIEQHERLNRESGHVVLDKTRCLCDYMSGIGRFWSEKHLNLVLYRCSITKMVDHSICVAVEPRLACLNRYPSCSAESTSFFIHGSIWPCCSGQLWSCERII
jgi:hypothetical protein